MPVLVRVVAVVQPMLLELRMIWIEMWGGQGKSHGPSFWRSAGSRKCSNGRISMLSSYMSVFRFTASFIWLFTGRKTAQLLRAESNCKKILNFPFNFLLKWAMNFVFIIISFFIIFLWTLSCAPFRLLPAHSERDKRRSHRMDSNCRLISLNHFLCVQITIIIISRTG